MMLHYFLRRAFLIGFVFVALTVLAFSLSYLFPGDVLTNISGLTSIQPEQQQKLNSVLRFRSVTASTVHRLCQPYTGW